MSWVQEPDLDTLTQMADFLDVSIDYLVGRSDIKKPIDENKPRVEDANLLSDFSKLNRNQKEKVQAFIQGLLS